MYNIIYETSHQSRFDAQYWMLGAGALGRPRGMVRGGRREEGSGWGTRVYLWRIHVDIWQNQYNIVKLKNKIKKKKAWDCLIIKKKKIISDCNFGAPVSYMNLDTQNPFQIPITVKFSGIISLNKLSQETLSSPTCTSTERKKVNLLSHVQLFVTPRTVAYQDPLSMGFSRQ